jgi:hypothetical protein
MEFLTVTPAYGRDYKSAKAALAAWAQGLDFILQSFGHPYDGKPMSMRDVSPGESIIIRFSQKRKIVRVK